MIAGVIDPHFLNGGDPDTGSGVREWLTPIGDTGFWVTPNEPADPFDCDRYPNSPYCNGRIPLQPFLRRAAPFGFGIGLHSTECELCIDLQPELFGLPLPDYSICYRRRISGCQPGGAPGGAPGGFSGAIAGGRYPVGCIQRTLWLEYIPSRRIIINQPLPPPVGVLKLGDVFVREPIAAVEITTEDPDGMGLQPLLWAARVRTVSGSVATQYFANSFPSYEGYPPPVFLGTQLLPNQPSTCSYAPPPPPPPPPNSYDDDDDDDMCDCEEMTALLRLIARRLGTQDYPVKVPKHLNRLGGDDDQDLQSLTEFTAWLTYQMDALVGQFPLEIEIEDLNPTEEGEQGVKIRLPNISETLAELYGLVARSSVNSDIHTSFLMRLASEAVATKNVALITQDYARANADFMGYKGNPKKRKIPYSFDVKGLDSLEKILSSTTGEIVGWESDAKDSMLEYLQKLMFAAGIIKAVHFRRPADLSRLMQEVADILGEKPEDEQEQEGWRDFIESINDERSNFNRNSPTRPLVVDPNIQPPENNRGGGR